MVKPGFDKGLIIPILLGCFSVAGLCIVLLFGQLNNSRSVVPVSSTETSSGYIYLGTEPVIFAPTLVETEAPAPTEPTAMIEPSRPSQQFTPTAFAGRVTNTPVNNIALITGTPTRTPTLINTSTPGASIYDDTDFRLVYSGSWSPIESKNTGAYQDTLHVSFTVGDSVTFTFIGQQVELSYQAGPSLGTVTVTLDSLGFSLDQLNGVTQVEKWTSGLLDQGTHTVVITHTGGGSINIDSITVPYLPTPTPTSKP